MTDELTDPRQLVALDYTNHRGERATRCILPSGIYFGATPWHPEPQWLLIALDLEKGERRDFALSAIHDWQPVTVCGRPPVESAPGETDHAAS